MSTSVGSIHYDLELRTEKFTASANKVKAQMASMSSSVSTSGRSIDNSTEKAGSSFAGMAGKAALVVAAVAGIGFAVSKVAGSFINTSAEAQDLRVNLDVLTGSAEKGAEMFKKLTVFAKETPFETTDLVQATTQLMAMGISVDNVMPKLKILGDISLGSKEKLGSLALVYGQISSKGRLMGDDLRQLWNVGFNPLDYWVQKSGKSMEYWQEEMSNGRVSVQMVDEAMQAATSSGGRFFNGMEKQSKTLNGRLSTLKDSAKMAVWAVMGIDESGTPVDGGLFDKVSKALEKLFPIMEKLATEYGPKLGTFFKEIGEKAIYIFGEILTNMKPVFDYLKNNDTLLQALKWTFIIIAGVIGTILVGAFGLIVGVLVVVKAMIEAGQWVWNGLITVFTNVIIAVMNVYNWFKELYNGVAESVNLIKFVVVNRFNEIKNTIELAVEATKNSIITKWNEIYNGLLNIVGRIIGFFAGAWSWLYGAGRNVIQGLINGIGAMVGGLWNTIAWVSGHIGRFFAGAGGWLWGVGVAIIQGLLGGMSAMAGAVFNKAQEIANGITSRIKSALSVRSPSRVMMGIGGNVAEGLVLGIQKGMSSVENISANMANAVIQPVASVNAPTAPNNSTSIQMGDIHIADKGTADYFFDRLNRNGELAQKGMATI